MKKDLPLILVAAVLAVTGEVALKVAMNRVGVLSLSLKDLPQTIWSLLTHPLVFLAMILYVFAVFFWMAALSRMDLNFAYPVFTAMGFVLVTFASRVVLQEVIPAARLIGVAIICIGLFVIAKGG
ncbi:MAG: hypothetical protein HY232_15675 [Acidobacteria bacterium]|nr:hypothetical protein [Acidobacteriota bacterium]